MDTILLVDVDPERADKIRDLLEEYHIPVKRCQSIDETKETIDSEDRPAVIVIHCELVNRAFTELAKLRSHPNVEMLFYCTDLGEKSGPVAKLPEELEEIIIKITHRKRPR